MTPLSDKRRGIIFWTFMVLFILAIPVLFLYSTGYRIGKGYSLVTTGGIYIHPWNVRGNISIDGKPIDQTSFLQKDSLIQSLLPSTYAISVTRDGYSTWKKNVTVYTQMVTDITPFIIPNDPVLVTIPKAITDPTKPKSKPTPNPAFKKIDALFADVSPVEILAEGEKLPTTADGEVKEKYITRRKMALWEQNDSMYAEWLGEPDYIPSYFCESELRTSCKTIIPVIANAKNVTRFDFYPGRNDIIIAALPDGLYAIELDIRDTQNSAQIFKGKNLDFRIEQGDLLYIKKDLETFLEVTVD